MKRTRSALRSAAAAAGIVLQFILLFAAAAPRMVWCHRPGGETVIEFEIAAGECHCDQCAQCRERGHAADPAAGPVMRASHCRHNEIDSEAGRTSGFFKSPSKVCSPVAFPSAPLFGSIPDPAIFRTAPLPGCRDNDVGPPGAAALRC